MWLVNDRPFYYFETVQILVNEVTQPALQKQSQHRITSRKILLSDFHFPKVALLAKRCTRMACCILDMFPEDPTVAWALFSSEIKKMAEHDSGNAYVMALAAIKEDVNKRDELIRFVSPSLLLPDVLTQVL